MHMVSPLSSFHIVLLAIAASKDWRPEMTLQDTCCLPFSLLLVLFVVIVVIAAVGVAVTAAVGGFVGICNWPFFGNLHP